MHPILPVTAATTTRTSSTSLNANCHVRLKAPGPVEEAAAQPLDLRDCDVQLQSEPITPYPPTLPGSQQPDPGSMGQLLGAHSSKSPRSVLISPVGGTGDRGCSGRMTGARGWRSGEACPARDRERKREREREERGFTILSLFSDTLPLSVSVSVALSVSLSLSLSLVWDIS